MKTSAMQQAIQERTSQIAVLQDEIKTIHAAAMLLNGGGSVPASRGSSVASPHQRESEKSPRRAKPQAHQRLSGLSQRPGGPSQRKAPTVVSPKPAGTVLTPLDRPDTIGGAMKILIRNGDGRFVPSKLWEALQAQYPELVTAEDARVRFNGNLSNWVYNGKLDKESRELDAACKWTAVGKEWFGA